LVEAAEIDVFFQKKLMLKRRRLFDFELQR
jgi:hypothetical protein